MPEETDDLQGPDIQNPELFMALMPAKATGSNRQPLPPLYYSVSLETQRGGKRSQHSFWQATKSPHNWHDHWRRQMRSQKQAPNKSGFPQRKVGQGLASTVGLALHSGNLSSGAQGVGRAGVLGLCPPTALQARR